MAKYDFNGLMEDVPAKNKPVSNKYDFSGLMDSNSKTATEVKAAPAKKSLYSLWGAEITPQMEQQAPYPAAIAKTLQQGMGTPLLHYLNMAGGGIPGYLAKKTGYEIPQPEGLPSKVLTGAADIAGFATGAPMRIGGGAASLLPKVTKGATLAQKIRLDAAGGATQFGIASFLHTAENQFNDWKARTTRGVAGAAVGAASGTVKGLMDHFTGLLSQKSLLDTGEGTRTGYSKFKQKLTGWFGKKLIKFQTAKPDQRVDLSKELKSFEEGLGDKAKFKALRTSSPRLRKALKDPNLTLQETQDLINQLKSGVSEGQLSGFKVRPSGQEVNEFINSVQKAKHTSFPEMRFTDKVYGKMSEYTNAVENFMKFGKTAQGIKTMIKNPETNKSLQTILPKETYDILKQTAGAQTISKEGLRVVDYLVRYSLLYTLVKNMIGKATSGGGGGYEEE